MRFRLLDLVLAAMADPSRSPAETLAFLTRRAALQARRDLAGNDLAGKEPSGSPVEEERDECAGFELGFAAALGTSEHDTSEHDTSEHDTPGAE